MGKPILALKAKGKIIKTVMLMMVILEKMCIHFLYKCIHVYIIIYKNKINK